MGWLGAFHEHLAQPLPWPQVAARLLAEKEGAAADRKVLLLLSNCSYTRGVLVRTQPLKRAPRRAVEVLETPISVASPAMYQP